MDDLAIVERQLGRPPRAFRRVAVRCPYGLPAVVEQQPFDANGEPFPTQFWLTCRHLAAQIARLEAAGGVERWSEAADDRPRARREPGPRACRAAGASTRADRRRGRLDAHRQPQVPARPRRVRARPARATSSATGSWPRPRRSGPGIAVARIYDRPMADVHLARHQWEEGRRAVDRARWDSGAYAAAEPPDRRRHRGAHPPRRPELHARRARFRVRGRRPVGARVDRRRVPRREPRARSRQRPTPRSTSTRAARRTTRHDGHQGTAAARAGAAAGRGSSPAQPGSWSSSSRGVGLGEALHDNPDTSGTQTLVRTLHPLPLVPVAHNTVTVTVTSP